LKREGGPNLKWYQYQWKKICEICVISLIPALREAGVIQTIIKKVNVVMGFGGKMSESEFAEL